MTRLATGSSQAGMAVVTAMLLVALAASAATFLLWRQQLWMQRVENLGARAQADALARAALEWRRRAGRGAVASPFAEASAIETAASDPQGLFNLNNVVRGGKPSEPDIAVFRRLLAVLSLPESLADALVDAIDADSDPTFPGGAEDLDYLAMEPPRRAPNRPLLDVSSLGRIKGFTPEAIARIAQHASALPEPTSININSAPAAVLQALVPGLDEGVARGIVAERSRKPFESVDEFRARLPEPNRLPQSVALGISSNYWLIASRVQVGNTVSRHRALVGAPGAKREGVVWRTEGGE